MVSLNNLPTYNSKAKAKMRVGRGIGSGKGKTCGRGVKGQKSRTGVALKGFEGGQMPLYRRLPKRGFNNIFSKKVVTIGLDRLVTLAENLNSDAIAVTDIQNHIIKGKQVAIKVLATSTDGFKLDRKLTVEAHSFSVAAKQAIEEAGGTVKSIVTEAKAKSVAKATE
jgi:large subunit ribosomal protein L15